MSLTNALSSSVSGLTAASTQISVIGDNIANANTPGFKEKRAEFAAVLGQNITAGSGFAQMGAGVRVNDVSMIAIATSPAACDATSSNVRWHSPLGARRLPIVSSVHRRPYAARSVG